MKTTKHFTLTALLVVGATLSAGAPARAQIYVGTIDLVPTGVLPGASGQATLSDVVYVGDGFIHDFTAMFFVHQYFYAGELTLTCQGLKPGGKYHTPLGTFTAARDGTISCSGSVFYSHDFAWGGTYGDVGYLGGGLEVYVQNHGNKRLVLDGWFTYPY